MNITLVKSIIIRFGKGFVAGGIASVAAALHAGVAIASFGDLKTLGFTLGIAFITGGLLAVEKLVSWTPEISG